MVLSGAMLQLGMRHQRADATPFVRVVIDKRETAVAQKRAASRPDAKTSSSEQACEDGPLFAGFLHRFCMCAAHSGNECPSERNGSVLVLSAIGA
jgi:hypothetical protein